MHKISLNVEIGGKDFLQSPSTKKDSDLYNYSDVRKHRPTSLNKFRNTSEEEVVVCDCNTKRKFSKSLLKAKLYFLSLL